MDSITHFLSNTLSLKQTMSLWDVFLAIGVAYMGGILSSLTPCIYPMIPITVSVMGGTGPARKSWHEVSLKGLAYVGGMAVVYSFLGVLAGLTGRLFGSFTNQSSWYIALGILMSIAALIMLDVFSFDPMLWWNRLKRTFAGRRRRTLPHPHAAGGIVKKEMTLFGAFFLGASSGLIAAPCTTPVLTSILAYIAKTQSVGLGFTLMLSFSLGLGTLLLLIAGFTGAVQLLPRSGYWMKIVKTTSGLILLAFAEYLIYRAGSLGGP